MLNKGSKGKAPAQRKQAATKSKPLPDESSDEEGSDAELLLQAEDDDESSSDESEDVTEEALERMMTLLGDVDAQELGLGGEDDEDEESGDEDEEEGSDDEMNEEEIEKMLMQGGSDDEDEDEQDDDEEVEYENLSADEDGDIVPVERTTVNDKVRVIVLQLIRVLANLSVATQAALERVLASFKSDTTFFDTLSLTNPKALALTDPENDLERELELYVFLPSPSFSPSLTRRSSPRSQLQASPLGRPTRRNPLQRRLAPLPSPGRLFRRDAEDGRSYVDDPSIPP